MPIVTPTPENITHAAALLRRGDLVAFPTETVYGLGANAFDEHAVQKIFAIKRRPTNNPLIIHIGHREQLSSVVDTGRMSAEQEKLVAKLADFWPGPLSLVLPAHAQIPKAATGGRDTVAVRIPSHPVARALLEACAFPIAAPSANPSTYVSPTTAAHVNDGLGAEVPLILDGGPCPVGLESTILSLIHQPPLLLRAGAVTLEQLSAKVGTVQQPRPAEVSESPLAPGMLKEHYAPHTPVALRGSISPSDYPTKVGLISFGDSDQARLEFAFNSVNELSQSGNVQEIAPKLFAALRDMDQRGLDMIVVDKCEQTGLGLAIMDRLLRASARSQK